MCRENYPEENLQDEEELEENGDEENEDEELVEDTRTDETFLMDYLLYTANAVPFLNNSIPYVRIATDTSYRVFELGKHHNNPFKRWLKAVLFERRDSELKEKSANFLIDYLITLAEEYGETEVHVRVAGDDSRIFYDRGERQGLIVVHMGELYFDNVLVPRDLVFMRPRIQKENNISLPSDEQLSRFEAFDSVDQFVNLHDNDRLLFKVLLVSALVPNIEHPILYFYGSESAGKTITSTVVKRLLDPAREEKLALKKEKDIREALANNWCVLFDNVTNMSKDQCEALCRFSTDDSLQFGCIVINSRTIQQAESEDFLSRSILFQVSRGEEFFHRSKQELMNQFEMQKPYILGAMFGTLARAMAVIQSGVSSTGQHRLADFERWAIAITSALGYDEQRILQDLTRKHSEISREIVENSFLGMALLLFMQEETSWHGSAADLLHILNDFSNNSSHNLPSNGRLPDAPQALTRELNNLAPHLRNVGVHYSNVHQRTGSDIRISYTG